MAIMNVKGHQIVDLRNDANYYFEVAPQGDSQARSVMVEILDNGVPYPINSNDTVIIEGKNAGGYNIFNSCALSPDYNNMIEIPLINGILSYAGVGRYIVAIYSGSSYINSFPFNIVVTEAPYDIARVEGSDSYEALNMAISKALSANRWWVEEGTPDPPDDMGASLGDYYMDAQNGNVYYTEKNASDILVWYPLMNNSTPPRQISVEQKVYIRYAEDSSGTDMSATPAANRIYMGIYVTNKIDSDPAVSQASNYVWSIMRCPVDNTKTVIYYAQTDTTTPPASGTWSTTLPTILNDGGYMWTKVHLEFVDGTSTEYTMITKNGRGIESVEIVQDGGDVSHGETKFRFRFNDPVYNAITPVGTENPQALKWYELISGSYVLSTDTSVVSTKTYYVRGSVTSTISVFNGKDAGFGTPTSTIAPSLGKPIVNVTTDPTSPDTAKVFNFDFNVRGAQWVFGNDFIGSGVHTSMTYTSANTVVGDMYLNGNGEVFRCIAVTNTNSTWRYQYSFTNISIDTSDLTNTDRIYGVLKPGSKSISIHKIEDLSVIHPIYDANDASDSTYYSEVTPLVTDNPQALGWYVYDTTTSNYILTTDTTVQSGVTYYEIHESPWYYHVKFLSSNPNVMPNNKSNIVVGNREVTVNIEFNGKVINRMLVNPVGTENPSNERWYVESTTGGVTSYVLTNDTTVNPNIKYYAEVEICAEIIKKAKDVT